MIKSKRLLKSLVRFERELPAQSLWSTALQVVCDYVTLCPEADLGISGSWEVEAFH